LEFDNRVDLTHRNLLWSKATVVNVATVEQCERSPRSAVPVANGRPERPLQNVGDLCSGTDIWKAVEDIAFACACACARRCNTSTTSRPLADIFGELAADADNTL
jgi:hypothetical protein